MAKDKITDYSATNADNSDIGGINIAEGCAAGNMNNAVREVLTHLAEMNAGTYPVADTFSFADPADLTKIGRFDMGSITTSTTRVYNMPNASGTVVLLDLAQTLTNKTLASPTITGTLTIPDDAIGLGKIADIADYKLLGNVSGGSASPAEISLLDEDDFASDSATAVATQQSTKAYVDAQISGLGLTLIAAVRFNGFSTPTINKSFNVASVTRASAGRYTVNFTNAAPDTNFLVVGTAGGGGTSVGYVVATISAASSFTRTTTSVQFETNRTSTGGAEDCADINILIYG